VTGDQARELAVWGPSHDALYPQRDEQSSVNFKRLTCGTFCVSKTVAAGQEYSSRGGARIYTQFLLVPAALLARFANNPFGVLRAVWAKGMLTVYEQPPAILESFTLAGRSGAVDDGLLAQVADQLGPDCLGRLVGAAVLPGIKLIAGATNYETLLGGLLNYFPVECRTDLTFTTGLRYSPRRPFHLAPIIGDAYEKRRASRYEGVTVVDLAAPSDDVKAQTGGWARYVVEMIRSDQLVRLAADLQEPRPGLLLGNLNQLGEQLLGAMHKARAVVAVSSGSRSHLASGTQPKDGLQRMIRTDRPSGRATGDSNADTVNEEVNSAPATVRQPASSDFAIDSFSPASDDPAARRVLERLDSAVREAMNGSAAAIENVDRLWTQVSTQLTPAVLVALREQYMRFALSLWHDCGDRPREPQRAIQILDLLEVLFKAE
jgi:hypothetical protein